MNKLYQAIDHKTSPETLVELAKNESINVRWGVANNLNTPVKTLINLAGEEGWLLVGAVLQNPNCPEMVKTYFDLDGYAGLSLAEFIYSIWDHENK